MAAETELLAVYDAHVGDLYAFLLRRCGRVELAEDLTQEVFVTAAIRFRDSAEVPARSWLYEVARSRLIDHWRRQANLGQKLRLVAGDQSDSGSADPADDVTSGRTLMTALDRLSTEHRAALVLRYLDDFTVAQVADALGRSVRATESLLVRARRKLELELKEQLSA